MKITVLKERVFKVALISLLITVLCSIWYYTRCGIQGLMTWHIFYNNLFKGFFAICLIPVIAFIPWLIWKNKCTKIISYVFSGVAAFAWIMMVLVLTIMNNLGTPASKLNLMKASDPLPVHSVAENDTDACLLTLGFGSDPHWGASHENADARTNILKNMEASGLDAVFLCGDIAEMGILNDYDRAIADLEAYIPKTLLRVIPGNHDTLICSLPHFKKMFCQRGEPDYYRMDGGSVHILVLCTMWDEHEFSRKQEKWLVEQLESIPQSDTVIVLSHCYLYGSGYYDEAADLYWGDLPGITSWICPILEKYNVDLCINGHDHFLEYLEKGNTSFTVVGAMGGALDANLDYHSPYSKWLDNTVFGWLKTNIFTDRIELEYYDEHGILIHRETVPTK